MQLELLLNPHKTTKCPWYSGFLQKHLWSTGRKQQYLTGVEQCSQVRSTALTSTMATWPCSRWAWISWMDTPLWDSHHKRNVGISFNSVTAEQMWKLNSPPFHHNTFTFCILEEFIHSVFIRVKVLLVKILQQTKKNKNKRPCESNKKP